MSNLPSKIQINGKEMILPIYFPDATRAVIRTLDSDDLIDAGIEGLVLNPYHLMNQPGTSVINKLGGLNKFMSWPGWVVTDSGGFQLFSLVQQNSAFGKITKDGITFYKSTKGGKKRIEFTPEKSIQVQFELGSNLIIALDYFSPLHGDKTAIEESVDMTIEWAKRCKEEYKKQIEKRKLTEITRPPLFAVVQGGAFKDLTEKCAKGLLEIGFDGFGLGGFLFDSENKLNIEAIKFLADQTPNNFPRFALGIGFPQDIVDCYKAGYRIFDSVVPTRDARHRKLYVFNQDPNSIDILNTSKVTSNLYILEEKYTRDPRSISEHCDCHTCQHYSRAYLNHLFKIEDATAARLATIHNLRTYSKLIELLRKADGQQG